jgi:hypothetical protein
MPHRVIEISSTRPLVAIARDEFRHEIAIATVSGIGAELDS